MSLYLCHKCGAAWERDARQPGFKETCGKCSAYLHCCRNCRFHRPSAPNQCHVPNTEYVARRDGLNFCEEFEFRDRNHDERRHDEKSQEAREAFGALFKDEALQDQELTFDKLFKE